jgi:hypothetical protein
MTHSGIMCISSPRFGLAPAFSKHWTISLRVGEQKALSSSHCSASRTTRRARPCSAVQLFPAGDSSHVHSHYTLTHALSHGVKLARAAWPDPVSLQAIRRHGAWV